MMWRPDGLLSRSSPGAYSSGLLASAPTTNAQPASQPSRKPRALLNWRDSNWTPSASWLKRLRRENGERPTSDAPRVARRVLLIVLCPLILATCSPVKLWQRDPAPAVTPCPIVQCLDRALQTCQGVDPPEMGVKTCQDAVLLASDALGEIVVCQQAHAALIQCVEDFNNARSQD
jgi:hypothetical protein